MVRKFNSPRDYKQSAKERLSGKWLTSVLAFFIAGLLGAGSSSFNIESDIDEETLRSLEAIFPGTIEVLRDILPILTAILLPLFIWGIVCLILGGAMDLGLKQYALDIADGREAKLDRIFCCIRRIGDGLVLKLLMVLFITLWSMLFVIPGIVASYRYALAPYIMAEDPDCGALEAINRSKALMDGYKGELFMLHLNFIGWNILNVFTLGILGFWLQPYMGVSEAVFCRAIQQSESYDPDEQITDNWF